MIVCLSPPQYDSPLSLDTPRTPLVPLAPEYAVEIPLELWERYQRLEREQETLLRDLQPYFPTSWPLDDDGEMIFP